jgi:glucose/arabinose dehydrogenase
MNRLSSPASLARRPRSLRPRGAAAGLLLAVWGASACSSDSNGPETTAGAGGDSTGNAGSGGESGSGGSAGQGGSSSGSGGTSGSAGASGSAGSGGSGITVTPDPDKDCGEVSADVAVPAIQLTPLVDGFTRPVYLTQPKGDNERLFVVEKPGLIRIVRGEALDETPFLDIQENVSEENEEMGLLGLAFDPEYGSNGQFYVYYSNGEGGDRILRLARYTVSSDPDLADPGSATVLFEIDDPEVNHNGASLEFGADGFLYIGVGDGGGGGDQHGATGNGQNLGTLLGKMLRIDVHGTGSGLNDAYSIPAGNITSGGALPEIWSYGLRNPWRHSFDACTGDMYIGDVGQEELEEVDFEPAGLGGRNYGWRLMEAEACFNPQNGCDASTSNLVLPVASYDHDAGRSITGGYVYRGHAIPDLRGTYLYVDYTSHTFFALRMRDREVALPQTDITSNLNPGRNVVGVSSFGQDNAGELYVMEFDGGGVYRIDPE